MLTCRDCEHAKEFSHYNPSNSPQDQQNLLCKKYGTVEPVWNWKSLKGGKQLRLAPEPAPENCFQVKNREKK